MSAIEQELDDLWAAAARFNQWNVYGLDAQADIRLGEITVYDDRHDAPLKVETFESLSAFQDWAYSIDQMDPEGVEDAVQELVHANLAREASIAYAELMHRPTQVDPDLAYERGDYKHPDWESSLYRRVAA